ncbi:acetate--CoA ligase family protein [Actinomadura sp. DC4]|uniref:bifunctional acetate--CoA ligase family protein/GNAT family N-acetyltransferase n=1 Tax=Actinomadura sp. DC4 TaxID=3055069 RepID=UPI0025B1997B|nr:acetate--CoA ligase family protein [Actinomadura sp. DC4]MDN3359770.1 acetate--CoA ligase family protein [Actinomadura sp. DC4]
MREPAVSDAVFALLIDGTQTEIRETGSADREAVRRLHAGMSPENLYLRFFSLSGDIGGQIADRMCRPPGAGHAAMGAWVAGGLVGVASYEATGEEGVAEVSLAVADWMHARGVGTLLLEHLAALARTRGVRAFSADTLAQNHAVQRLFADAGLSLRRHSEGGVVEFTMPLAPDARYRDAVAERERSADVRSLEHLLRPASLAVIGAGRRVTSIGALILRNVLASGYRGPVYAVNPRAGAELGGVPCFRSAADLPEPVDLAVVTVPAEAVGQVAEECGRRGVRSLVVITSGVDGRELTAICHRYGMRLVGPNCLGIANTAAGFDATFAASRPIAGEAGVVVQSGGVGIALRDHLSRLGIGVSTFASVGDKYDVSSNDMLEWWESDPGTRLGLIHVESFGNPRKFARTARRVGRRIPLLTVVSGRSEAGLRAAASHTAAAATPDVTREALFRQAGIVAVHGLGELLDAAAFLACQPVPAGPRVAIVSNAGGAGVLAADSCADVGLSVAEPSATTREALGRLLPPGAACAGPVDTGAGIAPDRFRRCVELVAADAGVDAVIMIVAPTAASDLVSVVTAGDVSKPLAAVVLGQPESVDVRHGDGRRVPSYAYPENAARALASAWSYGRWRARPYGRLPDLPGTRRADAEEIITAHLSRCPEGGWLSPAESMGLLAAYGLPLAEWRMVGSADDAVQAAAELGEPVVLKAQVPGVVHKSDAGAVVLGLRGEDEVRRAYQAMAERFDGRLDGVLIQRMAPEGVEVLCGITQEPVFGPLVVFGLGGVATDVLGDTGARLTPLTDLDAEELIRSVRSAPLLLGHRGRPAVDIAGLRSALLRLSCLAEEHPDIAELDLNPIIARPDGVVAVDARVRVIPQRHWDPYLRRMR